MTQSGASLRWSIAGGVLLAAVVATIAIPVGGGERTDQISARDIAKAPATAPPAGHAHAGAQMPPQMPPMSQAAPTSSAPVAWTLPPGWSTAPLKPMRVANFTIEGGGECGVFLFAGGGDRLSNVNRWRGQAGLPPLADAAALAKELTQGTCAYGPFSWLTIRGEAKAFHAAMLDTPGGQCFVKLEAAADRLDALKEPFLAFCASLHPGDKP